MINRRTTSAAAATTCGYIATIAAANWAVAAINPIPVGLGHTAPAGVLFAGLAFSIRDLLQQSAGKTITIAAIAAGTILSLTITGWATLPGGVVPLAFAAAAAFAVSELADMAVYTPLMRRGRTATAVLLSNSVGAAIDSALFLTLAFGGLDFFTGQMLGKLYMTLPVVAAVWWAARRRRAAA